MGGKARRAGQDVQQVSGLTAEGPRRQGSESDRQDREGRAENRLLCWTGVRLRTRGLLGRKSGLILNCLGDEEPHGTSRCPEKLTVYRSSRLWPLLVVVMKTDRC
ncbi:unnamed protein product [Pleuronectes platessa]|uniref:Uncharacterized protein n=1 Tax=Pleuronectes platessa TaxID=8262 RepID=A0A9N7YXP3_PLEPL|nr:unnamed protein product [Pleuronectes platessa]